MTTLTEKNREAVSGGHRCEVEDTYHSRDKVAVYCGRVEPVILCGYHAQENWIGVALASIQDRQADA